MSLLDKELLMRARECAEWHVNDGDTCGIRARALIADIDTLLGASTMSKTTLTKWERVLDGRGVFLVGGSRIVTITKVSDDRITFTEGCDDCFKLTMSKAAATQALREAMGWINE